MKNYDVFCDFDGTISLLDTTDALLTNYAHPEWLEIEYKWVKGDIGSLECLQQQIACLENFSESDLLEFAQTMQIDPHVLSFFEKIKKTNSSITIVSDGFINIIQAVLQKYHFTETSVFANRIMFKDNRVAAVFPHSFDKCEVRSGLCKCKVIEKIKTRAETVYIGDGISDICASRHCDLVFAKGKLAKHCHDTKRPFVPYEDFSDIIGYLKL